MEIEIVEGGECMEWGPSPTRGNPPPWVACVYEGGETEVEGDGGLPSQPAIRNRGEGRRWGRGVRVPSQPLVRNRGGLKADGREGACPVNRWLETVSGTSRSRPRSQ
eukprot:355192-Chlamydomonas_euryale.AAC.2